MEKAERKPVNFDGAKFNYFGAGVRNVCNDLNALIAVLKDKDFLQVDVNDTLCHALCHGENAYIIDAYIRHITNYFNGLNPLLISTAVDTSFEKKNELSKMLVSFNEKAHKYFRSYGSLQECEHVIFYDGKAKAFFVNEDALKEICTQYVTGDKFALFERVQSAIAEINAIEKECDKYGFSFLSDGSANANALIDVYVDGSLHTHFEKLG